MDSDIGRTQRKWRIAAAAMWATTALFALRVAGQMAQRWLPQPWLPPFEAWQGSTIGYPMLLSIQFVILGAMACASSGAWSGATAPRRRAMLWAAALGTLYMAAAIARIAIGYAVEDAPSWFSARISGAFHVVLAAFVLALAAYHFLRAAPAHGSRQ
jgi:hypothetical protein